MGDSKQLGSGKVVVGYCHPGEVAGGFHTSLIDLFVHDMAHEGRVVAGGGHLAMASGANIVNARNSLAAAFLAHPRAEWLFLVDSDMTFEPDTIDRLLEVADPDERPIVGGLCFGVWLGTGRPEIFPTMYLWRDDPPGVARMTEYPEDELVQVGGTGAACLLIHRRVLEAMQDEFPPPWPWFAESIVDGRPISEDLTFCLRAGKLGFPVHVHTGVRTGHIKPFTVDEAMFATARALRDSAPIQTYVVVPVKDRLDLTSGILRQLAAQRGFAEAFVLNNGSDRRTTNFLSTQNVAKVVDAEGWGIYEMWNAGVAMAAARAEGRPFNVAILNNDLELGEEFLERLARGLRSDPSVWAVSGNYDGREGEGLELTSSTFKNRGLAGFAFMVRGEDFAPAGGPLAFDEAFSWWFGDDDLVAQIEAQGGKVAVVLDAHVEHLEGGSATERYNPVGEDVKKADAARMLDKWGHY